MKYFLALLLISSSVYAGPCDYAWKDKPLSTCRLEWKSSEGPQGVELVELDKGCAFPIEKKASCALIRACGPGKEGDVGASVFQKASPPESYCLSGKDLEVFAPSDKNSPTAYIICDGIHKPSQIKLVSPDQKHTKLCKFPFKE